MIQAAYRQTGERVVILIDEYDAPMLDSINDPDLQDYIRNRIRNLFSPLKAQAQYLRFAADQRPVWAVGMNISQDRRTIDSYRIVQVK